MEPLDYAQLVTAAIAVVALVISWVSLVRSGQLHRQQMRMQTKQEELIDLQLQSLRNQAVQVVAQEKADVRVDLEQHARDYKFIITNWGRIPARNVRFDLKPEEGKASPLIQNDYEAKIPIAELAPGGRCPLFAAFTSGTGLAFQARWTWQNPDESEETRSSLLAI